MNILQYPYGRIVLDTIQTDSRVFRMDTLTYSMTLAQMISRAIEQSGKTKQQVAQASGIPWTTFCRRLDHPEKSFLTIPEVISICDALGLNFIGVLSEVEQSVDGKQFKSEALAEGGE